MNEVRLNLDRAALEALEKDAAQKQRGVEDEVAEIVKAELRRRQRPTDPVEWAKWIQSMTPVAVQSTDSLTLIREDRNR